MQSKLTKALIERATPKNNGRPEFIWDTDLMGFGVACSRKAKSFVVKYRNERKTIGRWPMLPLPAAREMALKMLADMRQTRYLPHSMPRLTLAQWLGRYMEGMRNRGLAPRSITEFERSVRNYLSDWLNK